jgi:hypothetical protein
VRELALFTEVASATLKVYAGGSQLIALSEAVESSSAARVALRSPVPVVGHHKRRYDETDFEGCGNVALGGCKNSERFLNQRVAEMDSLC